MSDLLLLTLQSQGTSYKKLKFILLCNKVVFHMYKYHILFSHSSVDQNIGDFQDLAIKSCVAINMGMQMSL